METRHPYTCVWKIARLDHVLNLPRLQMCPVPVKEARHPFLYLVRLPSHRADETSFQSHTWQGGRGEWRL